MAAPWSWRGRTRDRPEIDFWWLRVPITRQKPITLGGEPVRFWRGGEHEIRAPEPNSIWAPWLTDFDWLTAERDQMMDAAGYFVANRPSELDGEVAVLDAERSSEGSSRLAGHIENQGRYGLAWGRPKAAGAWRMMPIYDWETSDVWKAIGEHGWEYNTIYDRLYQLGGTSSFGAGW